MTSNIGSSKDAKTNIPDRSIVYKKCILNSLVDVQNMHINFFNAGGEYCDWTEMIL